MTEETGPGSIIPLAVNDGPTKSEDGVKSLVSPIGNLPRLLNGIIILIYFRFGVIHGPVDLFQCTSDFPIGICESRKSGP